METTNLTNEVVENVAEETIAKVGAGTVITGVCAATGAVVIVYGAVKGVQWVCNRFGKKLKASADAVESLDDEFDEEFNNEVNPED